MLKILYLMKNGDDPIGSPKRGARLLVALCVLMALALGFLMPSVVSDLMMLIYHIEWVVLGSVALMLVGYAFRIHHLLNLRRTMLMLCAVLVEMLLVVAVTSCKGVLPGFNYDGQMLLWMPYLLAPTILSVMVGRRLGSFAALCCTVYGIALFPADTPSHVPLIFCFVNLVTGTASALLSGQVHRREQILRTGFAAGGIVLVTLYFLMLVRLYSHGMQDNPMLRSFQDGLHLTALAAEIGITMAVNFILAALVGGMMPALERLFNISTPITWLEWADMNHPLLRKLQIAAPGTFHHSLVVQRLSEAAAEAVGANVTRAGVCGLYHDIGKIRNPQYFAENIADQSNSPHAELTPEASARIITGHVADGVELALEHGLNLRIVNAIREHHGVSTAYFFYRKATDLYDAEKEKFEAGLIDTCPQEVDKSIFAYKGPIPQTRESGIVSMADAVESATRSLQHPTEDDIRSMINGIFKGRILDGHLQDSGLTLGDIEIMKTSFFNTIRTMHHNRIAYPKPKDDDATTVLAEKRQTAKS